MGVGEWFSTFCGTLRLDIDKRSSLSYRTSRITRAVNLAFRSLDSDTAYRFYVGSMGRNTAVPTTSDVDLLVELPAATYHQYNAHAGNGQSALVTAVRTAIRTTYKTSDVFGDGQVVIVAFDDSVTYEVLPAFANANGGFTFGDTKGGGTWRECKPKQEMEAFAKRNQDCNGNLIELARMLRAWRDCNGVPMNGMLIDTLAYQFIEMWPHRHRSYLYYDFMTRDFFGFLAGRSSSQTYWLAPGSGSYVWRRGPFEYKARQAELRALEAIVRPKVTTGR
jgi:predicted nucleotidyltransferase